MINTSNTPIIPVTNTAKNQLKNKNIENTSVMVEFIAYFTDKDKGDILLPYIGMLMYQR
jgi:hypothetical protein